MLSVSLMLVSLWVVEPWRSLLINLSAGFIGSMITVFYVEKIIRRNEEHEWRKVMVHVGRQVNILANGTTSTVRLALGLDLEMPSSLDEQVAVSSDPRRMRQVMLALIENGLLPNLSGLTEMDQNAWKTFANNMLGSIRDAERILSLFSKNLDPTIMGLILDNHERARGLLLQ